MNDYFKENFIMPVLKISQKILDGASLDEFYFEELLDIKDIILFWKDDKSRYLACNKQFAKLIGIMHLPEVAQKSDYDLPWKKEQSDKFIKDDHAVMSLSCPQLNIREPALQADGTEIISLTHKFPIFSSDRKKTGLLGIITRTDKLQT